MAPYPGLSVSSLGWTTRYYYMEFDLTYQRVRFFNFGRIQINFLLIFKFTRLKVMVFGNLKRLYTNFYVFGNTDTHQPVCCCRFNFYISGSGGQSPWRNMPATVNKNGTKLCSAIWAKTDFLIGKHTPQQFCGTG